MALLETQLFFAQGTEAEEALVITLSGELSVTTAPAVSSLLAAIEHDAPGGELVIDLRDADVVAPAEEVLLRGWRREQIGPRVWRLMTAPMRWR